MFLDNPHDLHEGQHLEFKEAIGGLPEDLWETYSAFANTEGGEIVLGVQERGAGQFALVGVTDAEGLVSQFWSLVRNPQKVEHDIMLHDGVQVVTVEGKTLVVISVPRAEREAKPVRVYDRRRKQLIAWVRRADGDRRATDDDLRLMSYDAIPGADRKPLDRFDEGALCAETIGRYRGIFAANKPTSPWNTESDTDFLYHVGALAKGRDDALRPTQAGLLAFGHEHEITNYFPHYLLDYREERSPDTRWEDRIVSQSGDWSGNLIDFYYTVINRLLRHIKLPFATDATGTRHVGRNPIAEAVNEAVANALVHAYYGMGSITMVLHDDELVVTNPGTLLIDREVAIAGGFSEARNPTLMRIFGFVGAIDRAGSGLQMIYGTWRERFQAMPRLDERHQPSRVCLTIPLAEALSYDPAPHPARVARRALAASEVRQLVAEAPEGLTPHELERLTGSSARVAQMRLKELFEADELWREKEGRTFRYFPHQTE